MSRNGSGRGSSLGGADALAGARGGTVLERFPDAFFFSVQTFTSVGYGAITPKGPGPNLIVTIEAFVGLVGFATAAGLLFARFSRPTARIRFSEAAVIAPYRKGLEAFEFRIVNERNNQLLEVQVQVTFSRLEKSGERVVRRFYLLPLERDRVAMFPLHWTVVHPINDESPLCGLDWEDLAETEAEFLVHITAIDDIFSQNVHARSSYR